MSSLMISFLFAFIGGVSVGWALREIVQNKKGPERKAGYEKEEKETVSNKT